jgi:hypothetical protein
MATQYIDAIQAYRSERISLIESTWLNTAIPFQLFVTCSPTTIYRSMDRTKTVVKDMLKAAQLRYSCTMRTAEAYEKFPLSEDIHAHVCIASAARLDTLWFESYLRRRPVRYQVLKYSDPAIMSYVLKSTNVELTHCEVYLQPELNNRKMRRFLEEVTHEQT